MPFVSNEPDNPAAFARRFDRFYTRFGRAYLHLAKRVPIWMRWNTHALLHVRGPRVLEVSIGTGELMTRYRSDLSVVGVDLNANMLVIAQRNLRESHVAARLVRCDVAALPFPDESFDTVVSTMAFSGYPNGRAAVDEMMRVVRGYGRIVIVDFTNPADGNLLGTAIAKFWALSGDVIRDMPSLFNASGYAFTDFAIGAFGSLHLFVVQRHSPGHV